MTHVVLVHGAFHSGWCWNGVAAALERRGISPVVVELPLTSSDEDVAAVVAALDRVDGSAVVCAHSYGGQVMSVAASGRSDVSHLIYLTAFLLDRGETVMEMMSSHPSPMLDAIVMTDEGLGIDPAKATDVFYNETAAELALEAIGHLRPMSASAEEWLDVDPAWKAVPSTYVTCSRDNALLPSLQATMSQRADAVIGFVSDHSPFLHRPDEIADLIVARSV